MEFPLLSLPYLAFEQVAKSMDLIEVFELSQTSKTMFHLLKTVRRKVHPIKIIKEGNDQIIEVSENNSDEIELSFAFEAVDQPVTRHIDLGSCKIEISDKELNENTFVCYANQFNQNFDLLVKYLSALFRNDSNAFYIDHQKIKEIEPIIRNPIFEKCVALMVSTHSNDDTKIRNEDLELLLENKPKLEALMLNRALEEPEKMKQILEISRLFIKSAEWMKMEDLRSFNGDVLWLKLHTFTQKDVTSYVNHWLQENGSKVKQLHFDEFKVMPLAEDLLEDIEYIERKNQNGLPRFHRTKGTFSPPEVDCQNGVDIRKKDGSIATLVFNPDSLKFVVWND